MKIMKFTRMILACLIATIMIVSALPFAAFAQTDAQGTEDVPTNVITTFADLITAFENATGTADAPEKIYISGKLEPTAKLLVKDGQYIHLIGVGEGENGIFRTASYTA
ncbi:MAG: hypothetical protein IJY43_00295, partial [Clostridia bacterium]|nr:hypothetical protein [Clostridia bacterium]